MDLLQMYKELVDLTFNVTLVAIQLIQSQVQQVMPMATELLNMHPHQATTPYALKT
jgi:hypothetical protein